MRLIPAWQGHRLPSPKIICSNYVHSVLMASVRRQVERIIESDPVIKKGLQRRIINSRALARYILSVDKVESTQDGILGIIRRYPLGDEVEMVHRQMFKDCEIVTRHGMANLAIEKSPGVMRSIAEFSANIKTMRGENLRLAVGLTSIRIIAEQKTLEIFRQTLRPNEVVSYTADLAEISLLFNPEAEKLKGVKGIAAKITAQLVSHDVNLAGMFFFGLPEDVIMVAEDDAPRALQAIQQLLKEESLGENGHTGSLRKDRNKKRTPIPNTGFGLLVPQYGPGSLSARSIRRT